jgi:hypothetical protein
MKTGSLDAVSNRATFRLARQIVDTETNEPIDLTGVALTFEISRDRRCSPILSATIDNGKIVLLDFTTYQVTFSPSDMGQLCAGTYAVNLVAVRDGITTQIIIGTLPVLDGE